MRTSPIHHSNGGDSCLRSILAHALIIAPRVPRIAVVRRAVLAVSGGIGAGSENFLSVEMKLGGRLISGKAAPCRMLSQLQRRCISGIRMGICSNCYRCCPRRHKPNWEWSGGAGARGIRASESFVESMVAEASGSRTHLRHRVPHNGVEARAQHRPRLASTRNSSKPGARSRPSTRALREHRDGRYTGSSSFRLIPRSSNGRTAAFGAVNRGSNPCRGAIFWNQQLTRPSANFVQLLYGRYCAVRPNPLSVL